MNDLKNKENILMQFPCEPRLLDMRIVVIFALQVSLGVLEGFFNYSSRPDRDYYEFGLRLLSILDLIGYILLIPLAYFIFNMLEKPLTVTLRKEGIEFKYLFNRKRQFQYGFIKEIAEEREIEHVTLILANKKRITICTGSIPMEIIDQFVAELQHQNNLLKYCTFDSNDNDLLSPGPP